MKTVYILTGKNTKGHLEIEYFNGVLNAFKLVLKEPLTLQQFEAIITSLPYSEENITTMTDIGLTINRERTNQKIDLFCQFYMRYKDGLKYKVSPADSGKMKLIKVDEKLLEHYFSSQSFLFKAKHSISNLVKYYNELLAEIASANKSKHPNGWDKAYEAKLNTTEMMDYWRHLNSLGLKSKKDRLGNVIDWVPKEHL
ncbi:MAG: hypothetical protein WBP45_13230 [Daejeonella sp.]